MASGGQDMADGTRPNFRAPHTLHGAIKDFADEQEMSAAEAWLLAGKLLVYLASDCYNPALTPEMVALIRAARDIPDDVLDDVDDRTE
jgi:hypothetical protein